MDSGQVLHDGVSTRMAYSDHGLIVLVNSENDTSRQEVLPYQGWDSERLQSENNYDKSSFCDRTTNTGLPLANSFQWKASVGTSQHVMHAIG